ncbi:MAG: MoxR family ATPase [Deltaproteobacteria bacterium]|nr:MoxR family ATPase [Deltaproteobacteria bacterium]
MADGNSVRNLNPFDEVRDLCQRLTAEVGRRVVGQKEAVDGLTAGLLTGGNVLMEGVPGIGKTLLAKSLSDAVHLNFSRIQFTPDLMPADILGTHMVHIDADGRPQMNLQKGPLFANVILADEINRASPRTQAALLEAMQERQVSLGTETYKLDSPYFVVATQNPIDQEGTYPLPEAQLDRFLMKLLIRFPTEQEVLDIVARTTGTEEAEIRPIATGDEIVAAGRTIRQVPVADFIARYAVSLVFASHPETPKAPAAVRRYVKCGASPRAAQSVILVAKFFALLDGRMNVAVEDIQRAAFPCLRHRILINFDGIADDATSDSLVEQILHEIPRPKGK